MTSDAKNRNIWWKWLIGFVGVAMLAVFGLIGVSYVYTPPIPERHGKVESKLYVGNGNNQPLVAVFGGGEGGNAWTHDRWAETRQRFLDEGYAVLAVGYFGGEDSSESLDRVSLDAIHRVLVQTADDDPRIDGSRIALIGGSKGAELVLNLASRVDDIAAVIAMSPASVSFPAITAWANTSSWSYDGKDVPFAEAPIQTAIHVFSGDIHGFHRTTFDASGAYPEAAIAVEQITAPVLLISAKQDDMWPSYRMGQQIESRLRENAFEYPVEHLAIDGDHEDATTQFDAVIEFLRNQW